MSIIILTGASAIITGFCEEVHEAYRKAKQRKARKNMFHHRWK